MTEETTAPVEEAAPEPVYNTYVDVMMGDREDRTIATVKFLNKKFFSAKAAIASALGTSDHNIMINEVFERFDSEWRYGDRLMEVTYHLLGSKIILTAELKSRCNNY